MLSISGVGTTVSTSIADVDDGADAALTPRNNEDVGLLPPAGDKIGLDGEIRIGFASDPRTGGNVGLLLGTGGNDVPRTAFDLVSTTPVLADL